MLSITCAECNAAICHYQKDGPGMLRRMYLDRMNTHNLTTNDLMCPNCKRLLGSYMIYEKENRPAYRLFVGSVNKAIVKAAK